MANKVNLHALWTAPDNSRVTKTQYSFRLPVHVAAKIEALAEPYPGKTKTEIVGDLLAAAVADAEASLFAIRPLARRLHSHAAALFWYLRNRFFFDLGLDRHPAVMPLRYEDLLRDPSGTIAGVYRFVGMDCPRGGAALVRGESSGEGNGVELSADIEQLCSELLERLDRACVRAWSADSHPDFQAAKAMPQPVPARVR